MEDFKNRVKDLRLQNGLTQSQLAVKVNRGEATIRAWETGRAKPDADVLILLSNIFSCSIDYLLGVSDIQYPKKEDFIKSQIAEMNGKINDFHMLSETLKSKERKLKEDTATIKRLKKDRDSMIMSLNFTLSGLRDTIELSNLSKSLKDQLNKDLNHLYDIFSCEMNY